MKAGEPSEEVRLPCRGAGEAATRGSAASGHSLLRWREGVLRCSSRTIAAETAVALTYNGSTHAVMMATPCDLEDFGIGFTLIEGLVDDAAEISEISIVETDLGIEVRMQLQERRANLLAGRRRAMAGPVGCGLCGVESLEAARRTAPRVESGATYHAADLLDAMRALEPAQRLN